MKIIALSLDGKGSHIIGRGLQRRLIDGCFSTQGKRNDNEVNVYIFCN